MNMKDTKSRAGSFIDIEGSKKAFLPNPLPYKDGLVLDTPMIDLLSRADVCLGRLDGKAGLLPDQNLFVMMYIKKEAVLSSQIEGTQASLRDVLEMEAKVLRPKVPGDTAEVLNYISAMNKGLDHIRSGGPMDLTFVQNLHRELMKGVRGTDRSPGELRKVQNWVGPPGSGIEDAIYIPPPPREAARCMKDLERFMMGKFRIPPLIKAALVHSQFESIHPFLDGNGRIGRLLIVLLLIKEGHIEQPLLYLSHYLKGKRSEYYRKLQRVREKDDIEGYLRFFLNGVAEAALEASDRSRKILDLKERTKGTVLNGMGRNSSRGLLLMDALFLRPVMQVRNVMEHTGLSFQNSRFLVEDFVTMGVLNEITGQKRNRIYEFREYLELLNV
ncbi:MAG: Fic family protein [Candidatus Thermoplasmatota archaeon]|jgi:Fic family protein|nr:Fic family protein [Candidatus Thermoplasmatota archaeon]